MALPPRLDRGFRRLAGRLGYDVLRAGHYSPVPHPEGLPAALWDRPAPMPGVAFDLPGQLARLQGELAPFLGEPLGTTPLNPMYGPVDAELAHAFVRLLRPARIVELGSGWSTQVLAHAAALNGVPCVHEVVDPHPSPRIPPGVRVHRAGTEHVPEELVLSLRAGELLFADTTHTVRPGGDVVRLVLELLPRLASGVVVHVHDVFRPFEYPRELLALGAVWQEHHLVQALLSGSDRFAVLAAAHALHRLHPREVAALVPSWTAEAQPSGLWLRVR